jgi:hypothetical protein
MILFLYMALGMLSNISAVLQFVKAIVILLMYLTKHYDIIKMENCQTHLMFFIRDFVVLLFLPVLFFV